MFYFENFIKRRINKFSYSMITILVRTTKKTLILILFRMQKKRKNPKIFGFLWVKENWNI